MKPIQKISNSTLDLNSLEKYTMSINLRIDGLSFLVVDTNHNKIHMESFEWLNNINWDTSYNNLSKLIKEHAILRLDFKQVNIYIQSTSSFIIPAEYIIEEKLESIYQSYLGITNHSIFSKPINSIPEKPLLVFGVETRINKLLSEKWANLSWNHLSSSYISKCLNKHNESEAVFLNFQMNYFEVVATKNASLESHNYFYFNTADDFAFKIFSFCRQINLDLNTINLFIEGKIKEASPLHELLKKYVPKVSFIESKLPKAEQQFQDLIQVLEHENS